MHQLAIRQPPLAAGGGVCQQERVGAKHYRQHHRQHRRSACQHLPRALGLALLLLLLLMLLYTLKVGELDLLPSQLRPPQHSCTHCAADDWLSMATSSIDALLHLCRPWHQH